MKVKKMKIISKIVNEITSFYLEKGAQNIKIDKPIKYFFIFFLHKIKFFVPFPIVKI